MVLFYACLCLIINQTSTRITIICLALVARGNFLVLNIWSVSGIIQASLPGYVGCVPIGKDLHVNWAILEMRTSFCINFPIIGPFLFKPLKEL